MAIVVGLLILTCAGLMVGNGYHMLSHKDSAKTEHHMTMPQEHEHGQAPEIASGMKKADEEQKERE